MSTNKLEKIKSLVNVGSKITTSSSNVITVAQADTIRDQKQEGVPTAVICQDSAEYFMAIIDQVDSLTNYVESIPVVGKYLNKILPFADDVLTINGIYQNTTRYGFSEFSQSDIAGLAKVTLHLIEYSFVLTPVALGAVVAPEVKHVVLFSLDAPLLLQI